MESRNPRVPERKDIRLQKHNARSSQKPQHLERGLFLATVLHARGWNWGWPAGGEILNRGKDQKDILKRRRGSGQPADFPGGLAGVWTLWKSLESVVFRKLSTSRRKSPRTPRLRTLGGRLPKAGDNRSTGSLPPIFVVGSPISLVLYCPP